MKYIKYFFQFILIKLFFLIFKLIGYKNASNLGGLIGSKIGPIFKSKKIIKNNLKNYLQDTDDLIIKNIVNKMWENYGRIFAEYMFIKDFRSSKLEENLKINGIEYLYEIKKIKNQLYLFQAILIILNLWQCKLKSLELI